MAEPGAGTAGPKRFYARAEAVAVPGGDGWTVALDGRPVRTPARRPLLLPTRALADAVAVEWGRQGDRIAPAAMPFTGFAHAAVDRIADDPAGFATALAAYADTDTTCYRADGPADLVRRESEAWDPLLAWVRRRYDAGLRVVSGVMPRPQPAPAVERLRAALASFIPFELAALHTVTTISGSVVIALALAAGEVDEEASWRAGLLEELYQVEMWGDDPLAVASRADRRRSFTAAATLLDLLKPA